MLIGAPVLKIADPKKDFVVCTNACRSPYAGRECHSYESRKLKEHENNYAAHDLELAAIVHALKMWMHYLLGRKFELRTYHTSLKYLFD